MYLQKIILGWGGLRAMNRVKLGWGSFWERGSMMGVFIHI